MTQTADAIDSLERRMVHSNRDNKALADGLGQLNQSLSQLAQEMAAQRNTLNRLSDGQKTLAQALESMNQLSRGSDIDEAQLRHMQSLEQAVQGLTRAHQTGTEQISEELHTSFTRLGRTMATLLDQARKKGDE